MNFNTMSVSKLKDLKRQVETAIHTRVAERRHEIESELLKLSQLDGGRVKVVRASAKATEAVKAGKVKKSITAASPEASISRKPRKTRKARKETRKPETVSVPPLQMPSSVELIEAPSVDTSSPVLSNSVSEMPVDLGAAA